MKGTNASYNSVLEVIDCNSVYCRFKMAHPQSKNKKLEAKEGLVQHFDVLG